MAEAKGATISDAAKVDALLNIVLKTVPLPNLRAINQAAMEELVQINALLAEAQSPVVEEAA